ncbi:MAG: serine/threonine-protein kinase [Acidobacteriota bacterium]
MSSRGRLEESSWRRIEELIDEIEDLPPDEQQRRLEEEDLEDEERRAIDRLLGRDSQGILGGGLERRLGMLLEETVDELAPGGPDSRSSRPASSDEGDSDRADSTPTLELSGEDGELPDHRSGDVVGAYRLGEEIGRGGMGIVFLAERDDGEFHQEVAVKLIRGAGGWAMRRRFRRERQILAALEHPHVARLIDGGLTDRGVPYFVMELVDGTSLGRYCEANRLTVDQRLRLFLQVCSAVAHAHRNLIVHRDLKPGNILVTPEGQAKLLDFGIAKLLDEDSNDAETQLLGRVLTPRYAAPEQLVGEPVTTATDVFGLGLVLAELLAGSRWVASRGDSVASALRWQQGERTSLSAALTGSAGDEMARQASTSAPALRRRLRGDLEAIVAKALQVDPEDRYESAAALRSDLIRFLEGQPVEAARGRLAYRLKLFVRRHRTALIASTAVLLAVFGGLVSTLREARRVQVERDRAQGAEERAKALNRYLVDDVLGLARPEESGGRDLTVRELLDQASRRAESALGDDAGLDGSLRGAIGETYLSLGDLDLAEEQLKRSLERLQASGEASHELWHTRRQLARVRREQGQVVIAVGELEGLLADLNESSAPLEEQLRTQILLGDVLASARDRTRAERELRSVVTTLETVDQPWKPELRREALFALASTLQAQRRSAEATELAEELRALQERELGPRHPRVIDTLQLLAQAATRMQENSKAMTLQEQVAELREAVLGESHPKTLESQLGVANLLRRMGDVPAALETARAAADLALQAHGGSAIAVQALNSVGVMHGELSQHEESAQVYRQALAINEEIAGPTAPSTVRLMKNLLRTYRRMGDEQQQLPIAQRVFDAELERSRKDPDWTTLQDLVEFIVSLAPDELQDLALAEELALRAVELSERKAPESLSALARVYWATGRTTAAIETLEEALELPDALYLYSIERYMMFLLEERDGLVAAELFLQQHLGRRIETRGEESTLVAGTRWLLGRNLLQQDRPADAVPQLEASLAVLEARFTPNDDYVLRSRSYLTEARRRSGSVVNVGNELRQLCTRLLDDPRARDWVQRETCEFAAAALTSEGRRTDAANVRAQIAGAQPCVSSPELCPLWK